MQIDEVKTVVVGGTSKSRSKVMSILQSEPIGAEIAGANVRNEDLGFEHGCEKVF